MNITFTQMHMEAILRGLSAVSLVADELDEMAMEISAASADGSEKPINGYTLSRLADTLKAAEDSASWAREYMEKGIGK